MQGSVSVRVAARGSLWAFTLIELLVVIAIIAILAAILFPVFAKAREKGRQTACLSNTKQMAMAMLQYAQDNDETLPPRVLYDGSYLEGWSWRRLIYPYVKSTAVFICPSNSNNATLARDSISANLPPGQTVMFNISYAVNGQDSAGGAPTTGTPMQAKNVVTLAMLNRPPELILMGEYNANNSEINLNSIQNAAGSQKYLFSGHSGFANYVFGDGHAKALKPTATCGPGNTNNLWFNTAAPAACPSSGSLDLIGNLKQVEAFYQ